MPEFVEPKQLEQTRVLVKRARLTAEAQLGLTRESKATSESTQKGRQVSNTRRSQAFETRPPGKEDGGGAGPISKLRRPREKQRGRIVKRERSGEHQSEEDIKAEPKQS